MTDPYAGYDGPAVPPYLPHEPFPAPPPQRPRRPLGRALRVAGLTAGALLLLGGPLGLLWRWLAPDGRVVQTAQGPYPVDPQPEQYVAADGTFALLGLAFGVAAAIGTWRLVRRHRGPVQLAAVTLGTLAAGPAAWLAGRTWGHAEFERWERTAAAGTQAVQPPDLRAWGVVLVPAFAAVITYTLLAGWAHDPDLDPDAAPGVWQPPLSSDSPDDPAPTAAPAPHAPGAAAPPHG
ncbi:hypothetical protein [Spirilliplanes yamanashiensis]|uniref:DUF2567 domain-containing protein n=1 Tax=Spirilliplanes yamanashiensis TaxID=42233 RepID=A0A8J3Y8C5_9ACTN|nr:hypothetical protein [Spirilliplanes yamanashiensis]MDP9816979.1 hypothetical protein [Spirilliplanes yamanashiensis]GIJ03364.1 hypothetical protein Sya03_27160 [Spirilliplanes yamanashiensis]